MWYGTKHALQWAAELHATVGLVSRQAVVGAGAAGDGGAVGGVALVAAARALTPTLYVDVEVEVWRWRCVCVCRRCVYEFNNTVRGWSGGGWASE